MPDLFCPSTEDLKAFLLGDLADTRSEPLGAHLETCPRCAGIVQQLDNLADPFLQAIRIGQNLTVDTTNNQIDAGRTTPYLRKAPDQPPPSVPGYEILEELGHGGMGVVYKARQIKANRVVALKMILTSKYASVQEQVRFQIEAEAVAHLQHPHIVQLHEVGEHDGMPFFSLEFCDGGALDRKLKTWAPSAAEASSLVETLARALHYAHLRGVVHRDLKPANVLLASGGREPPVVTGTGGSRPPLAGFVPKITDFGLAKKLDSGSDISRSGVIMGTPSYMAPEQAEGKVHDTGPAADVYGLGALLYVLLAGRPPFKGATTFETVQQVLTAEPVPPSRLRRGTPRDLETICLKCLGKQPGQRYASAEALADDLRRYRQGEPIAARPVGLVERAAKWARRNPAVAALLLVTVLGVAGIVWKYLDAERLKGIALLEADKAIKARDFLVSIFRISETDIRGGNITARQILADAEKRIPVEFADQPELRADLEAAIEEVKRNIERTIPAALILEARGALQIHSARGASRPAVPQVLLFPEDRLALGGDAHLRLCVLADLHQEWLKPGREVLLGRKGCEPADAVTERSPDILMTFVPLSKGRFYMGWDGQQKGTKTEIKEDFEIAVHTVTQGQWQAVMGNNPSTFSRKRSGKDSVLDISDEELKLFPVEYVSWDDAQAFIEKLNEKERGSGFLYRLPTEAEWEYACRGGATSEEECSYHFYFAKPTNDLSSKQANFNGSAPFGEAPKGEFLMRPARVGAYPANKLGLCDMHGNVWQWCADPFRVGVEGRFGRVIRGGCLANNGDSCRAASRDKGLPSARQLNIGFRLARVLRPAALILEARGAVQIHSARGASRPAVPQVLLFPEDRLALGNDAHLRLYFLTDLHQEWLKQGREVLLGRKGCEPADAVSERSPDILMTFVRLPKGTFYMGWDGQQKGTKTEIKEDFEIAVHTVTQGQWQAVMGNNPSTFSRKGRNRDVVRDISDEELKLFPVESVSCEYAQGFIEKVNEKERGRGFLYRLPTKAEWEYACRAGAITEEECSYHFYFDKPTNDLSSKQANFNGNFPFGKAEKGPNLARPTRVGAYPPNKLGLCDMHGNVWQWCADPWGVGVEGARRVIRGGFFDNPGDNCRAALRSLEVPSIQRYNIGFRLVRVPRPVASPTSQPAALILEARGALQIHSARGTSRPAVLQDLLFPDDRLALGDDAHLRLCFLADLHQEWLKPGREVLLGRKGCEPADAVTERSPDILMTFVRLPKETFYMGWDGQKKGTKKGTKTEIKEDFEIAVHTVTQGQWQAVMGNNPSSYSRKGNGRDFVLDISDEELKLFPVEGVSWEDAQAFIKKLNEKERGRGFMYRLPTEAEWEYACRGGATSEEECSYHFYFDKPTNDLSSEQANFNGTAPFGEAPKGKNLGRPARVGAYPANKLGLCDMHGNVWQWCADRFDVGASENLDRVIRGGNWYNEGAYCRTASRFSVAPAVRYSHVGFRLVRVPVQ